MADTVDRILMRYQSQDFNKVIAEQQTLAKRYDDTSKSQEKVNKSSTKLEQRLSKLQSFGRNLRQAGGFLGSDTIAALGDFADGVSDIGDSINTVTKSGGKLNKLLGGIGAVVGGVAAGTSIYDATIGKLQGTNTGTILDQLGQFAGAGFNVERLRESKQLEIANLRADIQIAQLSAANAVFDFKQQAGKLTPGQNTLAQTIYNALGQTPLIGGGFKPFGAGLGQVITRQQGAADWTRIFGNIGGMVGGARNFAQAGQALGQRQAGAKNVYQSALYAIEQDTGRKRAEIARTYAQSLIAFDNQYYLARQQAAQEFGIEAARMEADHQKDVRRRQQDHEDRLKDLFESRDALAIEDEIESYNKERTRAEEDYQDAARLRQEDYARQMAEMERAHQEQRNERQRAHQEQLRELNLQAAERRRQEYMQYQLLLKDIVDAFVAARRSFSEQINNSNTTVNSNNRTVNVENRINAGMSTDVIIGAVNSAIVEAFR